MSDMKQVCGLWLPTHEEHLGAWVTNRMRAHPEEMVDGRGTYQYHKQLAALKWVRRFDTAIDVGGHCGLWSMQLAKRFDSVIAFEPVELHRRCFLRNYQGPAELTLHDFGLGERNDTVSFHTTPGSSGDSFVSKEGTQTVQLRRMDDVLPEVVADFVKLDCEGFELFALRGGEELLKRSRPVVIVEQKPGRAQKYGLPETGAVAYLQSLGAVLRREIAGDFILSWDEEAKPAVPEADLSERLERVADRATAALGGMSVGFVGEEQDV